MRTIRENEQENDEMEEVQVRTKREQPSGKKSAKKDLKGESRTLPLMGVEEVESRGRRFKVVRML